MPGGALPRGIGVLGTAAGPGAGLLGQLHLARLPFSAARDCASLAVLPLLGEYAGNGKRPWRWPIILALSGHAADMLA